MLYGPLSHARHTHIYAKARDVRDEKLTNRKKKQSNKSKASIYWTSSNKIFRLCLCVLKHARKHACMS